MFSVEGNVRGDDAVLNSREAVFGLVELVIDFTNPSRSQSQHFVRSDRPVIVQQESAAGGRFILHAVERIRHDYKRRVIKAIVAEGVAPLAPVDALRWSQNLVNGKAPDM